MTLGVGLPSALQVRVIEFPEATWMLPELDLMVGGTVEEKI